MTKLNQLLAIEKGAKQAASVTMTKAYQDVQRDNLFSGVMRFYQPKDDEGDQLPAEHQKVVLNADDLVRDIVNPVARYLDVTFEKDVSNTVALADIRVGDLVVISDVPVTYLLFLEKQLTDLHTFISKLPTLDPSEYWDWNPNSGVYESNTVTTNRTQKVPRSHVLYEATDRHPAQVQAYTEDVIVGTWDTTKLSGALPAEKVKAMKERVQILRDAVKTAREEANSIETAHISTSPGHQIFKYVFGNDE